MQQLSTKLNTHKAVLWDGKEILMTTGQFLKYMALKTDDPKAAMFIGKESYSIADIKRVVSTNIEEHQKEKKEVYDALKKQNNMSVKTITKENSKEAAHRNGYKGKAWQCPYCDWWCPYAIKEDVSKDYIDEKNRHPYMTTFTCIKCGK